MADTVTVAVLCVGFSVVFIVLSVAGAKYSSMTGNRQKEKNALRITENAVKAQKLHSGKNFEEASVFYEKVRLEKPLDSDALHRYAMLLCFHFKDYNKAENVVNAILQEFPGNIDVMCLYATICERKEDYTKAKTVYEDAYRINSQCFSVLRGHSLLLSRLKEYADARWIMEEALVLKPSDINLSLDYACLLEYMAAEVYVDDGKSNGNTSVNISNVRNSSSDTIEAAAEIYEKILALDPSHQEAMDNYAGLLFTKCKTTHNLDDLNKAIHLLEKCSSKTSQLHLSGCRMLKLQICGCNVCGKYSNVFCGNCNFARYCSKDCQKKDWKLHKKKCPNGAKRHENSATAETTGTLPSYPKSSTGTGERTGIIEPEMCDECSIQPAQP